MIDQNRDINGNFFQLILSLQVAAMQQMGKIASPITGKVERSLEQAKVSIDMLEMLEEKTRGNLSKDEKDLIDRVLYEARMNFLDESKKPEPDKPTEDSQKSEKEKEEVVEKEEKTEKKGKTENGDLGNESTPDEEKPPK